MVTPISCCAISMVTLLCDTNKNCVFSLICLTKLQKRSVLLSSSGASTSSIKQNGAGLSLNIANTSAIAVSAFSPPDNKAIVVFFLPGGCAKTCKPLSNISLPCSSSLAWPPANKVLKSALKCIFTVLKVWVNCSRVSPSIFNMASSKVCVA